MLILNAVRDVVKGILDARHGKLSYCSWDWDCTMVLYPAGSLWRWRRGEDNMACQMKDAMSRPHSVLANTTRKLTQKQWVIGWFCSSLLHIQNERSLDTASEQMVE